MKYAKWLLCLLPFVIGYLSISFINLQMDITLWEKGSRVCLVMFGLLFGVIIALPIMETYKKPPGFEE